MTPRELMARTLLLALSIYGFGILMVLLGATSGISRYIFAKVDYPSFGISIAALSIVALAAHKETSANWLEKLPVSLIALVTLVASIVGTHVVYLGYAFSPDEWMPRLQAEIFARGHLAGTVPPEWREYGRAIYHGFAYYDSETGSVASSYRPGMAILIALFDLAGLGLYVSAFMLAGSVLLVASLARQIWPASNSAPVIAALLVATSSQALAAALTSYAMGPHLFFNLLWLRLFLHDKWWSHGAAALCGVFTASLHQIHPHLFFVAPFFLLLLRPFRPGVLIWYGAAYLAGHLAVLGWDRMAMGGSLAVTESGHLTIEQFIDRVDRLAQLPDLVDFTTIAAHLVRFIGWQSLPLLTFLLFVADRRIWTPLLILLTASIVTTLLPYPFIVPDQGHGWGYRYLHGLIGSVALIGTAGWIEMERLYGTRYRRIVILCFVMTLLLVVPVRGYLIKRTIEPWLAATTVAEAMPADVVIVNTMTIYYGHEIPRTGPFVEERPVVMMSQLLSPEQIARLCSKYRVAVFGAEEAKRAGVETQSMDQLIALMRNNKGINFSQQTISVMQEKHRLLTSPACNSVHPSTAENNQP